MRNFLQISPTGSENIIATRHLYLEHINTFHLLQLIASEVEEWIRSDTIAKLLTWYFSWFSQVNERFSSDISHQHEQNKCYQAFNFKGINTFYFLHPRTLRSRNGLEVTPYLKAVHDILADLVNSMRGFLQNLSTSSFLELLRLMNGSGMAPWLNAFSTCYFS